MSYTDVLDVYRTSGISESVVSYGDVIEHIKAAENAICRITKNIYWKQLLSATAVTSATTNSVTLTSAGWLVNNFENNYVWIISGTGKNQIRKISANTTDTLTVTENWTTNPDNTSYFKIFYVPEQFNPYREDIFDGNAMNYMYLPYYPVKTIETLSIDDTEITDFYLWEKTGRVQLKGLKFTATNPQNIEIDYWYGVDYLPYEIKRLVDLKAAIQIMSQQMGGTYNVPSTISLPDMNVTIGQAYINIKTAQDTLIHEYDKLLEKVTKIYPVFG